MSTTPNKKKLERKKTTSCGTCVYRVHSSVAQVLLIKPFVDNDAWGFPKGHIDEGETREECAIRETREETGLDVELITPLNSVNTISRYEDKDMYIWLARQICNKEPHVNDPDNEVSDVRWFNVDELPRVHVYQRPVLDEVLKILERIVSVQTIMAKVIGNNSWT